MVDSRIKPPLPAQSEVNISHYNNSIPLILNVKVGEVSEEKKKTYGACGTMESTLTTQLGTVKCQQ